MDGTLPRGNDSMKSIAPRFAEALLDPQRRVIDLLVVRLVYGDAVVRLANYDDAQYLDVSDGDGQQRFEPLGLRFAAIEGGGTMEVDRCTLDVPNVALLVTSGPVSEQTTLGDMCLNNVLDGAELWRYQVNLDNLGIFYHSRWDIVGAPMITPTTVTIELQSALGRCVRPCPMTVLQASCNNSLFDTRCAGAGNEATMRAAYTVTGTATGGSRTHLTSALAQADSYFSLGEVEFTGGLNIGARRSIGKHTDDGSLFWADPLRFAVVAGDQFTVCAGCDKTWSTCDSRFSNTARFRGFPSIPDETVMF